MSEDKNDHSIERRIADAIEEAQDGLLEPALMESIRELLLTSSVARRYLVEVNALNYQLAAPRILSSVTDGEITSSKSVGSEPFREWRFFPTFSQLLVLGILATVILGFAWKVRFTPKARASSPQIASVEHDNGTIVVTSANAETRTIQSGTELHLGDTVRTQGARSSAVLVYSDGTRLSLVGDSSLTLAGHPQKRVILHGGKLFGSVVPQPKDSPFLLVTPQDEARVLGTSFSLGAKPRETELRVKEGSVHLTRLRDGKSVNVLAGQRAVSKTAELVLSAIPKMPEEWSENFEDGLPAGWEQGKFVTANLPAGSKGAVQAVLDPETKGSLLVTGEHWTDGLFTIHNDTHLNFKLKMQDPGWINIFLLTKADDGDLPRFAGNYIFDQPVWNKQKTGQWGTLTIPLSKFRPLPPSSKNFQRVVPFQLLFSSPKRDRGLVIDRIWVTRGGPGTVEIKDLENIP